MTNLQPPQGVPASAWARIAKQDGNRWAIAERAANGEIIGTAYRDADGGKTFAPGGRRGLIVAWRLATYAGASIDAPVFVCEGASDTAAVLGLDLDAVGVPMAGHCGPMVAELLANRHAVIVADADDAGRRGAAKIAKPMAERCASVRIMEPPLGAKDARAAVIAGADRSAFLDCARAAKPNELKGESVSEPDQADGSPVLVRLSDVEPRNVLWLWEGRIPRGRISLLSGRPGEGKSMATMDWAARVSSGRAWPDGSPCPAGSVVLVAGEDDPYDTIRPRLDAHNADPTRVHLLQSVMHVGRSGVAREAAFTLADLRALESTLTRIPDCALVIVDPIGSFLGGGVDAHRDNEVRSILAPLANLAQRSGAAVLLVAHQRKGAAPHADDLVLGSRAFTGLARSVLHLLSDPDNPDRRLMLPGKMNLSRPAPGLAFTIGGSPPQIEWEPDPVALTADGVLAAQSNASGVRCTERDVAIDWLKDFLYEGSRPALEVIAEAKAAGLSERTVRRAMDGAGVSPRKTGLRGGWLWELAPGEGCQSATQGCQTPTSGSLGKNFGESRDVLAKIAKRDEMATLGAKRGRVGRARADGGMGHT